MPTEVTSGRPAYTLVLYHNKSAMTTRSEFREVKQGGLNDDTVVIGNGGGHVVVQERNQDWTAFQSWVESSGGGFGEHRSLTIGHSSLSHECWYKNGCGQHQYNSHMELFPIHNLVIRSIILTAPQDTIIGSLWSYHRHFLMPNMCVRVWVWAVDANEWYPFYLVICQIQCWSPVWLCHGLYCLMFIQYSSGRPFFFLCVLLVFFLCILLAFILCILLV